MSYICDEDLPDYGSNACQEDKSAAINAFAVLKRGQTTITDFSNPTQWETALANGDAKIAKDLTIDVPDGSPINVESKRGCGPTEKQNGVNYTASIIDPNVSAENDLFYTGINGKTYDIVLYYCEEEEIRVMRNGTVSARLPQSVGNGTDTQHYNVTLAWRYKNDDFGEYVPAPAGIFTA